MNPDSSRPSAPPAKLRQRLKEATHEAIIDAAESVFVRDGVARARMEDVAAEAGVAVGTLYNYFSDREQLVEALLQVRREALFARMDEATVDRKQPFEQRLLGYLTAIFAHFAEHSGLFNVHTEVELMMKAKDKQAHRPALRTLYDRKTRIVKDGIAEGALRADDADLYPAMLMGMVRGLFMQHMYGIGPSPSADAAERVMRMFMQGAGVSRETKTESKSGKRERS